MSSYTFTIPVNPVGKGRPRFGKGRTYTPARTVKFEEHVAAAAREAKLPKLEGAIGVTLAFYVEPQPGGPADLDNYVKAVLDGLKEHFNDRRVRSILALRYKAKKGEGKVVVIAEEQGDNGEHIDATFPHSDAVPVRIVTGKEYAASPEKKYRLGGKARLTKTALRGWVESKKQ